MMSVCTLLYIYVMTMLVLNVKAIYQCSFSEGFMLLVSIKLETKKQP